MTLQASGNTIKFSQIVSEFGNTPNNKLGEYRVNQPLAGKNWPLDNGIPTSGTIKFSDFYSKRLNIVIDSGTGSDEFDVTLTNYWNSKTKTCVGNFKSPESTLSAQGAKKYNIVLRKDYGGNSNINTSVKSGYWPSGSILNVYVSGNATVYGRGGRGGNGSGDSGSGGGGGSAGFNAIGFNYDGTLTIDSGSGIIAGSGGGSGGKGCYWDTPNDPLEWHAGGGGGGGGRGNPGGDGGISITSRDPGVNQAGDPGQPGTKTTGGAGGAGRSNPGCTADNGQPGGNTVSTAGAGNGIAILANSGITVTVTNNGTVAPSATPVTDNSFN